jgi:hypothetical protein
MSATPLSYSTDLTREEIIARFRDRINAGKRSKLGKTELEQLILHFIDRLKNLDEASAIKSLCDAEIDLLEEGYAQSTLASDYIPKYRKAIEAAIEEGTIQVIPTNSHQYLHTQRVTGKEEERFEHYALTYFKYDEATYEALDSRSGQTNRQRQLNLQGVNPHLYLQKLTELLHSQEKFASRHRAIAIAGLTGRRIGEVVARGRFSLSHHPYLLRFEGHSKVERSPYDIVTLIEASELLPHLELFREGEEIQPFLSLDGESLAQSLNQFDVQVNRECKKHLGDIVPPIVGRDGISVHNLRSLWGAIAAYLFCPPTAHEYPFLQHYLGHVIESPATGHYFRYRLLDESGRFLDSRGILLPQCGELPLPGSEPDDLLTGDRTTDSSISEPETILPLSIEVESIQSDRSDRIPDELILPSPPEADSSLSSNSDRPLDRERDSSPQQLALPLGQDSQGEPTLRLLPALDEDEAMAQQLTRPLSEMLNSDRYTVMLAALMAATGRSPGELIKSGTFEPSDETFAVSFSPTGVGTKSQLICLVDGAVVIEVISRLRSHRDTQSLRYQSPSAIDAHCQLYVAKAIAQYLPFDNLEAMNRVYSTLTQSAAAQMPQIKTHPATVVYNLYGSDKQRLVSLTHELGFDGTQPEVFRAFLDWVQLKLRSPESEPHRARLLDDGEERDRDSRSDLSATTISHQAQTLAWLTSEVQSLRDRLHTVELERDSLKHDLELARASSLERDRLYDENLSLKSQLLQAHTKLNSLSNLLGHANAIASPQKEEPRSGQAHPPEKIISSDKGQTFLKDTSTHSTHSPSFVENEQSHRTDESSMLASTPDGTTNNAISNRLSNDNHSQNSRSLSNHGGKALARAKLIFEAIQQWNSLHPDDLFAINRGLLETVFGINRKAVQNFTDSHCELLEQYHQSLGILPFSHNRGKDTSFLKAFVNQVLER